MCRRFLGYRKGATIADPCPPGVPRTAAGTADPTAPAARAILDLAVPSADGESEPSNPAPGADTLLPPPSDPLSHLVVPTLRTPEPQTATRQGDGEPGSPQLIPPPQSDAPGNDLPKPARGSDTGRLILLDPWPVAAPPAEQRAEMISPDEHDSVTQEPATRTRGLRFATRGTSRPRSRPSMVAPRSVETPPPARPEGTESGSAQSVASLPPEPCGIEETQPANRPFTGWVISRESPPVVAVPAERRVLVIGDCENDSVCVEASLRFTGLLDKQGQVRGRARGAQVVQTGDLMFKGGPSPGIVRFWEGLRTAAAEAGCGLHLVAGNHELEIWRRLQTGERLGLNRTEQRAVQALIRSMVLFHVEGSMLFMHGYPTLTFLRHLRAYQRDSGKALNDYNADCFQKSFTDARQLARYAYLRGNLSRDSLLLHDVADPERYYRRHGREVAALLGAFGIDLVVHGHRPERSGIQADYELRRWLPTIRMINNDVQLRLQGLGATLIKQVDRSPTEVRFINRTNLTLTHRADVRQLLRASYTTADVAKRRDGRAGEPRAPGLMPLREYAGQGLRGETRAATR